MNNTSTGGPAFPMNWVKQEAPNLNVILEQRGMTLRDYFAAKAMAIVLPPVLDEIKNRKISDEHVAKLKQVSTEACYGIADAMLKAREQ